MHTDVRTRRQAIAALSGTLFLPSWLNACAGAEQAEPALPGMGMPPPPRREFRGVWIAVVDNIDWPSRPGLGAGELRAEIASLLDRASATGLNAVIVQVRASADAIYPSARDPWCEFVTGRSGVPPSPRFDPLEAWIDAAHERGLDFHAWFNPFRARHHKAKLPDASGHVTNRSPGIVRQYGQLKWLDPGEPEAHDDAMRAVLDVVQRYDIDGVHIDDYFYPYPEEGKTFDDARTFAAYQRSGGTLGRSDWRRRNVDTFVARLYREVKAANAKLLVGISPFGIWRPGHPAGVTGLDAFEALAGDARKWMREGWADYFSPQLYWPRDSKGQPFAPLLDWWLAQNAKARHVWPGLYASRVEPSGGWSPGEISGQVQVMRTRPACTGHVHFSLKAIARDHQGLGVRLRDGAYAEPALLPASPWLRLAPPSAPTLRLSRRGGGLTIELDGGTPRRWVVALETETGWETRVLPGPTRTLTLGPAQALGVRSVAAASAGPSGSLSPWAKASP